MKRILSITLVIILVMGLFVMPVNAEETGYDANTVTVTDGTSTYSFESYYEVTEVNGTEKEMIQYENYYVPDTNYTNVMIIYNDNADNPKYYLIYYNKITSISNAQINGVYYFKDFTDINQLKTVLFSGIPVVQYFALCNGSYLGSLASWSMYVSDTYTKIYKTQDYTPLTLEEFYNDWLENPCSHVYTEEIIDATCYKEGQIIYTCEICYEEVITVIPAYEHNYIDGVCDRCGQVEYQGGVLGWFQKIFATLEDIAHLINPFNSTATIFNLAGDLLNEKLADNPFYTSILSVRNTFRNLLNEDYSSRTGFYELGLTNITLGKTQTQIYRNFGNDTIGDWEQSQTQYGEIDYGLDNVKVLNLDWYFGETLGVDANGYEVYTKGMKPTIDAFISAFLWLLFAWALYKNMAGWISGEITQIGNLTTQAFRSDETVVNTRTVDNKTGEVIKDTTTTTKRGKK